MHSPGAAVDRDAVQRAERRPAAAVLDDQVLHFQQRGHARTSVVFVVPASPPASSSRAPGRLVEGQRWSLSRVRLLRVREQRIHVALLDDLAAAHHDHAVADVGDDAEVVRDDEQRHAVLLLQARTPAEHLGLHGHVERRGGLVGDEDRRPARDRAGDQHALRHAARDLVRIAAQDPVRSASPPQQHLARPGLRIGGAHAVHAAQRLGELVADRVRRVEVAHRLCGT
jgi:hypothetical protein